MNKKYILPITLILLVGLTIFVSAISWEAEVGPVEIKKGWNLVWGFMNPEQLDGQVLEKSSIKAIYAFIPSTQEYARVYPNQEKEKLGMLTDDQSIFASYWIYSDKSARTEYWLYPSATLNERKLFRGWNFIGMTPEMVGKSLNEIISSCSIEKAYGWDYNLQGEGYWNDLLDEKLPVEGIGGGFVVKVSNDCKLTKNFGGDIPSSLPQLPN